MTRDALTAIVTSRLRAARRTIVYACAGATLAGAVQLPYLESPVLLCSFAGMLFALAGGPGRNEHLDSCEQSAPLFGRELARAKAIVPCLAAFLVTLVYSAASLVHAGIDSALYGFAAAIPAVAASTLVALCASLREGGARLLYVALACATAITALELAAFLPLYAELAFCALAGFLALRQYGEALARYDPVYP